MAKVTLYGFIVSPPFRGSMMSCAALGVEYELEILDPTKMEHHQPQYFKLNPIHSIPTMVDGDFILFDSHAISCYLANQYGKDDKWYPKDPRQRGVVDQRLHFDCSVLIPAVKNMGVPIMQGKQTNAEAIAQVKEAAIFLDKLLGDKEFIALNHPTLADCHCAATALSIQVMLPNAVTPRMAAWLGRCKTALPSYEEINNPAVQIMKTLKTGMPKL